VEISLTQGQYAQIDDDDYALVKAFRWCALKSKKKFYAITTVPMTSGAQRIFLHKLLLGIGKEHKGDHINGDSLDCRRINLRVATSGQNSWNKRRHQAQNKTSRHRGVFFDKRHGKFRASILHEGRRHYLGYFAGEEAAAAAYDAKCLELRGEWAVLNNHSVPGTESAGKRQKMP